MSDLKAKMHQNRFRLGLCPRPCWGSIQCLAEFKRSYFQEKERGAGKGGARMGKGEKGGKGREGVKERKEKWQ